MLPGDRSIIYLGDDDDLKDSIVLMMDAMPGVSYEVTSAGSSIQIRVTKEKVNARKL
jgi:hypothetical protein